MTPDSNEGSAASQVSDKSPESAARDFQALLQSLDPDPAAAGMRYENLRWRLVRFFRWNDCVTAEDLADVALNRLGRRVAEDPGSILDLERFATGIARMLVREQIVQRTREEKALDAFARETRRSGSLEEEKQELEQCLAECVRLLSVENRDLIERYYTGDASERIRGRKAIADELGISLNTLRNRVLRLRRDLESCARKRRTQKRM